MDAPSRASNNLKQAVILQILGNKSDTDFSSSSSEDEKILEFIESCSSSSDEAEQPRRKLHRIKLFVERLVPVYDDIAFKQHFRLGRATCNILIEQVTSNHVLPVHTVGRKKITPEKGVLMTVWYLSNTETFRQVADRFDVTLSSAHRVISKIIKYLVRVSKTYINWPNYQRRNIIRSKFQEMHGIKGIIGAIDGCHIIIKKPVKDAHAYCNRKGEYSILLQAVCDHEKKFIDFFCGEAGSIHDARLLKRSAMYEKGSNGLLGTDFLLGDSAYPCLQWLIPPFRDNGNLTRNQKTFNYRHSSCRIVIEHSFGMLKGRFRRLRYFENENIMFIVECVVAAGVLHNICIDWNDETEYYLESDHDDFDPELVHNISGIAPVTARRDQIFREMFNGRL